MAYIFITDNDNHVKDMLDHRKAAAYLPYNNNAPVAKVSLKDKIFIYRTKKYSTKGTRTGIIAFGYADKIVISKNREVGSDYVNLANFTELQKPMPYSVLNAVHQKHYKRNNNIRLTVTTKKIDDACADLLLAEITLNYL